MSAENYITSSCNISDFVIHKDGSPLYENKGAGLASFLLSAYHHLNMEYPKFYKMDMLSKLGILAAEVLLKPDFAVAGYLPYESGVVITNASSSLDSDSRYYETTATIASPSLFVYTLPNIMIGEICIKNNIKGENAFFVFSRFDAGFIHRHVSYLLDTNILQVCICGWVELLEDDYKAFLMLVEKKATSLKSLLFTIDNINKIYRIENG